MDLDALQATFFRLSREVHPDRFAGADPQVLAEAHRRSARVNDAYRVLRDEVLRTEHLLALEGVEREEGEAKCPPDLLEEVFEIRERLAEGATPELAERVGGRMAEAEGRLAKLYEEHDSAPDGAVRRATLGRIREALDRRKFLANLVREVERASG